MIAGMARQKSELETLPGANRNTLKLRLRELAQEQRIAGYGKARATWYTLNPTPSA